MPVRLYKATPEIALIKLKGRVTAYIDIERLRQMSDELAEMQPKEIRFDLSECEFLDSRAISRILDIYRRCSDLGSSCRFCNANKELAEFFADLGIGQFIPVE